MSTLIRNGNKIGGAISKLEKFQIYELPTPSSAYAGKIYQYIGETNEAFINGYFYKCELNSNEEYGWNVLKTSENNTDDIFVGTIAEWESLEDSKKDKYKIVNLTDDDAAADGIIDDTNENSIDKTYSINKILKLTAKNIIKVPYFDEQGKDYRNRKFTVNTDRSITISSADSLTTEQIGKYSYFDINRIIKAEKDQYYTLTLKGATNTFSAIYFTDASDTNVNTNVTYILNGIETTEDNIGYIYSKDDLENTYDSITFKVNEDNVYFQIQVRALRELNIQETVYPLLEIGKNSHKNLIDFEAERAISSIFDGEICTGANFVTNANNLKKIYRKVLKGTLTSGVRSDFGSLGSTIGTVLKFYGSTLLTNNVVRPINTYYSPTDWSAVYIELVNEEYHLFADCGTSFNGIPAIVIVEFTKE